MRNLITALVRSVVLAGLALAVALIAAVTLIAFIPGFGMGMVFLLPWPIMNGRRATNLVRRACGRWCGVDIPEPYQAAPPSPERRPDGFFERDNQLHKRAWWPLLSARLDWLLGDRATGKDLLWMLLHPIVGGAIAGTPLALIVAGIYVGSTGHWYALLAVPAGLIDAPVMVRIYGQWCRVLLAPVPASRLARIDRRKRWLGEHMIALWRLLVVGSIAALAFVTGLLMVLAIILTYGVGLFFVFAPAATVLRDVAEIRRKLAGRWSGAPVESPYRPVLEPVREPDGRFRVDKHLFRTWGAAIWAERQPRVMRDPATWRDLGWAILEPITGTALAFLAPAAIAIGFVEMIVPTVVRLGIWVFGGATVGVGSAAAFVAGGLVLIAVGAVAAPITLRWHGRITAALLAPTENARLARRIEQLTETRTDAIDVQAAEVRRIERDLHDGAQARIVSVGLSLGVADELFDTDPEAARRLIRQARDASETALTELRDLVRGVHPPVLSERGLGDAVRALALDCPLPVAVDVDLPGDLSAPVSSAAYFALSEALANAVRHAGATSIEVEVCWRADTLLLAVTDDGTGGADPACGTGLAGIARRLGTFDGSLAVKSPKGGPTEIRMEIPCALSSPRI